MSDKDKAKRLLRRKRIIDIVLRNKTATEAAREMCDEKLAVSLSEGRRYFHLNGGVEDGR